MSPSDPRSVVRIAIALVALKHKPRDQSLTSYLLDLQSRFPLASKDNVNQDWRTYALDLEKQLSALKAQRDADQELLSRFHSSASQATSNSDAPPPKKKSKKNPTKDPRDPVCNWDQDRADWSRFLSSQYPYSPSLIAAYTSLNGTLASPKTNADLVPHASRLADAVLRVLDAIHIFLFSSTTPSLDLRIQTALGTSSHLKPEYIDSTRIALIAPLLTYVLRTALPALLCATRDCTKSKRPRLRPVSTVAISADAHVHVDRVLDRLLECILLPLLRSLVPLCSARLAPLLTAPLKKDKAGRPVGKAKDKDKGPVSVQQTSDVCTDVFALICTSLEALDALPPGPGRTTTIQSGIRDRLGLETLRELEALYAIPPDTHHRPPTGTPSEAQPLPTPASPSAHSRSQSQSLSQAPAPAHPLAHHAQQPRRIVDESLTTPARLAGRTRADRVRALATKRAGWFLASTLHLCVVAPAASARSTAAPRTGQEYVAVTASEEHTTGLGLLLREALLERIGKLVWTCLASEVTQSGGMQDESCPTPSRDSAFATIDPVCRHILLAVCERALSHLALP